MAIRKINSAKDVKDLVDSLTDTTRSKPVCLISTEFNSTSSQFDLRELESEIGAISDIVVISTGPATFELASKLTPGLQVFGGAARVYPLNFELNTNEYIPLIYPDKNGTSALISQVWACANISALKREQVKNALEKTAKVKQIFPFEEQSRAVVEFADGTTATIRQELSFPNVPFDWIFSKGDTITGLHDVEGASFLPTLRFTKAQDLIGSYEFGNVIPVLVISVDRKRASCCLFPGINLDITLPEISGNDIDLVSDFLVAGDVVGMRLYRNPQGKVALRMDDIDDHEICHSAEPIFVGGQPWLIEGRNTPRNAVEVSLSPQPTAVTSISQYLEKSEVLTDEPKPRPGAYTPIPAPVDTAPLKGRSKSDFEFEIRTLKDRIGFLTGSVEALGTERDGLFAELARATNDLVSKSNEFDALKKTATSLRRSGAKQSINKSTVSSRRNRFASDVDWFNEELRRVWISTYTPSDRSDRFPLDPNKMDYGVRFFDSLKSSQCSDNDLKKVLRCILDILTGREAVEPRHQVHPIRDGEGAGSQDIVATDGSIALRAYVEEKTAAAKRLHYWMSPSKRITLERVVTHNDYKP